MFLKRREFPKNWVSQKISLSTTIDAKIPHIFTISFPQNRRWLSQGIIIYENVSRNYFFNAFLYRDSIIKIVRKKEDGKEIHCAESKNS